MTSRVALQVDRLASSLAPDTSSPSTTAIALAIGPIKDCSSYKRRKMGSNSESVNDNSVPMDGVEPLDSSTAPSNVMSRCSPTSTATNPTIPADSNAQSNNEAIAMETNQAVSHCYDKASSKGFASECSPAGTATNEAQQLIHNNGTSNNPHLNSDGAYSQNEIHGGQDLRGQMKHIRGFGHLFDDDDLD